MHLLQNAHARQATLPATANDIAVTILPATAALPAVAIEPATAVLATVATELTTPALATVAAEPATAVLATVATEPATAELDSVATDPATALVEWTRLPSMPPDLTTAFILREAGAVVLPLSTDLTLPVKSKKRLHVLHGRRHRRSSDDVSENTRGPGQ